MEFWDSHVLWPLSIFMLNMNANAVPVSPRFHIADHAHAMSDNITPTSSSHLMAGPGPTPSLGSTHDYHLNASPVQALEAEGAQPMDVGEREYTLPTPAVESIIHILRRRLKELQVIKYVSK